VSGEALGYFLAYDWPGNVRELRNMVERLVIMTRGDVIGADDLPAPLRPKAAVPAGEASERSLREARENFERAYILAELRANDWNMTRTSERLGIERSRPYLVCLQETKVADDQFPFEELRALGYEALVAGQQTYNGVAVLTRAGAEEVARRLPDEGDDAQRRLLVARVAGLKVMSIYGPNGQEVGSDKYAYKLDWYRRFRAFLETSSKPDEALVLCGDLNIAPEDRDVWDPEKWRGQIMFSDPERAAFRDLVSWGLRDSLRLHRQEGGLFTWWDYRAGAFHRGWGLRIDHVL